MEYDRTEALRQTLNEAPEIIDVEERRYQAFKAFNELYARAQYTDFEDVDENTFKEIIIDIDAVLPALTGVWVPRAFLLKAWCFSILYEVDFNKMYPMERFFAKIEHGHDPHPLKEEAIGYATVARELLERLGYDEHARDISDADYIISDYKTCDDTNTPLGGSRQYRTQTTIRPEK